MRGRLKTSHTLITDVSRFFTPFVKSVFEPEEKEDKGLLVWFWWRSAAPGRVGGERARQTDREREGDGLISVPGTKEPPLDPE